MCFRNSNGCFLFLLASKCSSKKKSATSCYSVFMIASCTYFLTSLVFLEISVDNTHFIIAEFCISISWNKPDALVQSKDCWIFFRSKYINIFFSSFTLFTNKFKHEIFKIAIKKFQVRDFLERDFHGAHKEP